MNIILFGLKTCGKTTLGASLAELCAWQFIDTDRLIEKAYWSETGQQITMREIYRAVGNENFRNYEKKAVQELKNLENTVIAVGGSTLLDPDNYQVLKKIGFLVYLQLDQITWEARILAAKELPAFIDPDHQEESLAKYYQARNQAYQNLADEIILSSAQSIPEVLNVLQVCIKKISSQK